MAWTEAVDALTTAGIKSATIANNHITDYGGEGALFTQKLLQDHNIDVIGLVEGKEPPYSKQVLIFSFVYNYIQPYFMSHIYSPIRIIQ